MAAILKIILLFTETARVAKSTELNSSTYLKFNKIRSEINLAKAFGINNLETCTIISVCDGIKCDPLTFSNLNFQTTFLNYNYTSNYTNVAKASRHMKLTIPCSFVIYNDIHFTREISYEWIYNIPGSFYKSAHIFFLNNPPNLNETSLGFRLIFNQFLIIQPEVSNPCDEILTTDLHGKMLLPMGNLCLHGTNFTLTNASSNIFLNKWNDFQGAPYSFAMSSVIPIGPKQPELDYVTKHRSLRYNMFELNDTFKGNLKLTISLIELTDSINATATLVHFPTQVFVKSKVPGSENKYEGLAYELSLGNAHACLGLSSEWETSKLILLSETSGYDSFSFLTGLPKKSKGSLWFIFEAYDLTVWIVYSFVTSTLISMMMLINRSIDARSVYAVLKPVLEQSLEPSVLNSVLTDYKARILLFFPLLLSIVAVSLFKSNLASLLVKPIYIDPPRTIRELADSGYEIGTFMSENTELGTILRDLNETALIKKMWPRFRHYDLVTGPVCFFNVVKGPYACLGLISIGKEGAIMLLRNAKTGHEPFIWSKDSLMNRYLILGMSKFMPHVKDGLAGFEERNRLRSKSSQNRAHRRKKRANKKETILDANKDVISDSELLSKENTEKIRKNSSSHQNKSKSANFNKDEEVGPLGDGNNSVTTTFGTGLLAQEEKREGKESAKVFRRKHHSSFVVRLPGQKSKFLKREVEKSKSFELPDSKKDSEEDEFWWNRNEDGDHSVGDDHKVMTWFKGPASSHDRHKESGMGANGSAHVDGRLKSRSQSSSALYCIGKSSSAGGTINGSGFTGIEHYPVQGGRAYHQQQYLYNNYNHLNHQPGNSSTSTNGLSNSIPTDLWDLPQTTKSFSPITQKHNHHSGGTGAHNTTNNPTYGGKSAGNKQHKGAMPSVVDAIAIAATRSKKGGGGGGKNKNRSKLYAVSCPDVAQHTQCANATHQHCHEGHHYGEEYTTGSINPLQSILKGGSGSGTASDKRIEEGSHINSSGYTNGGFIIAAPEGYRSIKRNPPSNNNHQNNPHNNYPHPVISNIQLAQSHPHLYLNNSSSGNSSQQGQVGTGNHKEGYSSSSAHHHHAVVGGGGPGISASYQNLPSSFYLNQEHLKHHQSSSNVTNHHHQQQQHQNIHPIETYGPPPSQQYLQKQRGSLPNKQPCDFDNSQSQEDPKCSFFPIPTFVIPENIFEARLQRDQRGLGLSVTGGLDSQEKYPGLIRIKKVFPMSPASQSGNIRPWDIILQANGVPLTGLTNHEALEVLRTTPTETILTLCRPPPNVPGFVDTVDHSCSQTQLHQHFSSQQQFTDPMHSSYSHHPQSCKGHHQYENDGYTSGASSAFNPSAKSKSLSSLKIPSSSSTQSQQQMSFGEFQVTLEKVAGSLGFTLRQEDTSILGHYVRALVKDPAMSDGRIKPGDRILSVNGQDLSEMSHAEAINFLRQCPSQVTLRLYRDTSPTPISPLSPTESHKSIKAKPLRQEAIDMLNDLAIRKQMNISGTEPKYSLPGSAVGRTGLRSHKVSQHDANCPATLPRRRHAAVTPSPEVLSAALSRFAVGTSPSKPAGVTGKSSRAENTTTTSSSSVGSGSTVSGGGTTGSGGSAVQSHKGDHPQSQAYPAETRSSGSGESTPVGTIIQHKNKKTDPYRGYSDLRSDSILSRGTTATSINEDEVTDNNNSDIDELNENDKKSGRRKASFRQFTLHLDQISSMDEELSSFSSELNHHDSIVSEPGGKRDGSNFRHGQPAYQSAILPSTSSGKSRGKGGRLNKENFGSGFRLGGGDSSPTALSDIDIPSSTYSSSATFKNSTKDTQQNLGDNNGKEVKKGKGGSLSSSSTVGSSSSASTSDPNNPAGLLKWKGVLFSKEDEEDTETTISSETLDSNLRKPVGSSSSGSDQGKTSKQFLDVDEGDSSLPQRRSPDGREFRECDMEISSTIQADGEQIFTVQLSRRWCSRLGFSLQGSEGHTYISAIYPDSVAAKDGRLRVGDEVIMVNGETIRDLNTSEVIDNMRKTRGIISITLLRKPSSDPDISNTSDSELGLR